MHRSLVIAIALTATVCAKIITIETSTPAITTEGGFREEYTTADTIATPEITNGSHQVNDSSINLGALRKRRCDGPTARDVTEEEFKNSFSFVVAIYSELRETGEDYICLGSILTPRLILTARHCVTPPRAATYIRANTRNRKGGGVKYDIKKSMKFCERGCKNPDNHDIALIQLATPITDPHPVTLLPPEVPVPFESQVVAVGWGRTREVTEPPYLRRVEMKTIPIKRCKKVYDNSPTWLCTESDPNSTCEGDSGGPVLYQGKQVGVVSHGKEGEKTGKKCGTGYPTANVNVKKYWNWIHSYLDLDQNS